MWRDRRELIAFALIQVGMPRFAKAVECTHSTWMLASLLDVAKHELWKELSIDEECIDRSLAIQDALRIIIEAQREWKAAA